jgi:hypothetical protein
MTNESFAEASIASSVPCLWPVTLLGRNSSHPEMSCLGVGRDKAAFSSG